jgi:hypothetical protein
VRLALVFTKRAHRINLSPARQFETGKLGDGRQPDSEMVRRQYL